METLRTRLVQAAELTNSLAAQLSAEQLQSYNGEAPSNSIGGQFWCVVGARESYARAFTAGEWQGFSCSLQDIQTPGSVQAALADSQTALLNALAVTEQPWDEARLKILYDLLEHEAQHHGQLIRYFYANSIPFPADFAHRYALS
ncbi:MAG: hypothetical protein KIT46_01320 [Anaerolineales bacterium]|nr:hypothetical protein [Anaerolineales bacterium]MCW5854663.1 hypothetical protein [Anaerolineales bacterium]